MALGVTLLGTATFNTSSGSKTVTATPAVGDLIVIVTAHSGNTSSVTPTDDNSSGTYTTILSALKNASADKMMIHIRDSLIGAANSTVFTHAPGTSTGGGLAVFKVTGMQKTGATAARQSAKQENQAAATPAPVFGSAPLSVNAIIGAIFNATNVAGMTPRTNFTERCDVGYNTPASGLETMSRDSGETATTQTWGSASASAFASAVVELDSSQTLTPSLFTNSQTFYSPTVNSYLSLIPIINNVNTTVTNDGAGVYTIEKTSGVDNSYDASAVSSVGVSGDFVLRLEEQTNTGDFLGLSVNPLVSDDANIDFAWQLYTGLGWRPEKNSVAQTGFLTPAAYAWIWRIGSTLYWGRGSTLADAQASPDFTDTSSATLKFDSTLAFLNKTNGVLFYTVIGAQNLTPSLFTNSQTFYSPAISTINTLTPNLFTNSQTFFAPTVGRGAVNLSPSLFTNSQIFFAPTVAQLSTIAPNLFTNSQVFYSPIVTSVANIIPSLFTNTQNFFTPTITKTYSINANLFTNSQTFYAPTVTRGAVNLTPALFVNSQTFYSPTITTGPVGLTPVLFTNNQTFYSPTITTIARLFPSLLANSQTFFTPTVTQSAATIVVEASLGFVRNFCR